MITTDAPPTLTWKRDDLNHRMVAETPHGTYAMRFNGYAYTVTRNGHHIGTGYAQTANAIAEADYRQQIAEAAARKPATPDPEMISSAEVQAAIQAELTEAEIDEGVARVLLRLSRTLGIDLIGLGKKDPT